jgi:hypothetical protein
MNPTAQSGMHPDAESLTAFAEQLLPVAERDHILAHMATCGRCREVVFLAQHAASQDQPVPSAASPPAPRKQLASWLNSWRWMWIPATAFAGLIGVAVVQHFRHAAPEAQMTAKLSHSDSPPNSEISKSAPADTHQEIQPKAEFKRVQPAKPSQVRDDALSRADKGEARQLDEKKSVERNEITAGTATAPNVVSPGLSGGSAHGTVAAKTKSSPYDGPAAANQFQQNALQEPQDIAADAANKPAMANAAPASASQTAVVQAERMQLAPKPAPAAPPQVSSIRPSNQKYDVLSGTVSELGKAQKITLPSGLAAISLASGAGRSIALDTAGAMFLSEDGGNQWQPIRTQWTGRAEHVRTRSNETQNGASPTAPAARFELMNDKLQTWISSDGKTWSPASPAEK